MAEYNKLPKSEIEALSKALPPSFGGVEQSEDMLEWIWNHFSAVAGDQPSFECWRESCPNASYPASGVSYAVIGREDQ